MSFDESAARPGEALPLTVGVTNGGGATLDSCTVEVRDEGGKVVATEEVGLGLASGASGEAKASVTLPERLDRALTYRVSVAPAGPGSEGREVTVGAAHLSVRAVASMDEGTETVTATVTNRGLVASAAGRAIFYNPELGGELGTLDLPAVAPGGSASAEKFVPEFIWAASPAVKRAFLQSLFEGDGSSSVLPFPYHCTNF